MRWILGLAILLWVAPALWAQDGGNGDDPKPDPNKEDPEKPNPEKKDDKKPEEPPVFKLPDRDRKKVDKELSGFLIPSKKSRAEEAEGLTKLAEKPIEGHSLMEDVAALVEIANHARVFGNKVGKAGSLRPVDVPPKVHGFPGGVGTVRYWMRLPKEYRDKQLWPVIFCLPDTKVYPDTEQYLKNVWMKSDTAKEKYILVVPTPSAKGKQWRTDDISFARAMITLRHVMGTFDATRKDGGPASDTLRVFIDGEDTAAAVAARFAEMFAGVVLRGATGSSGSIKLRGEGALNALPGYCIIPPKKKRQQEFAGLVKKDNEASVVLENADPYAVDPEKIVKWMDALPVRTVPRSISYTVHDSSFQRHHWINVLRYDGARKDPVGFDAVCDRAANTVTITNRGLVEFEVSLNDSLVDLNRDVTIRVVEDDKEYVAWSGRLTRDLGSMLTELIDSNQPWRVYPARVTINMPAVRKAAAAAEARKKAEEAAKAETEKKGAAVEVTGGSLDR